MESALMSLEEKSNILEIVGNKRIFNPDERLDRPSMLSVVGKQQKKVGEIGHSCYQDMIEIIKFNLNDIRSAVKKYSKGYSEEEKKKIYLTYFRVMIEELADDSHWKELSSFEKREFRRWAVNKLR